MTPGHGDEGYVTIGVIGLTTLMAALVAALLTLVRPTALLTRLDVEQLHRQTRIEAGLNTAAFLLFFKGEAPASVNGRQLAIDGGTVRIEVSAEKGRVDLNTSGSDLLRQLFAAAKCTSMTPTAFAARVLDWRDEDDDRTIEGGEAFEYAATPDSIPPTNGPFRSVDELRFLLGLSAEDRARIEPFLTTFNREGLVDPKDAVGLLRAALGGYPSEGGALLAPRSARRDAPPSGTMPEAFRVTIVARTAAGRFDRGAVTIIAPAIGENEAYSLLQWQNLTPPSSHGVPRVDRL